MVGPNDNEVQAFIIDVDGTLLGPHEINFELEEGEIHIHLHDFFNKLKKKNIYFTIATGRAFNGVKVLIPKLKTIKNFEKIIIIYNGAVIVDSLGRIVYKKWEINNDVCEKILEIANHYNLNILFYMLENTPIMPIKETVFTISINDNAKSLDEFDFNGLKINHIKKTDIEFKNIVAILLRGIGKLSSSTKQELSVLLNNISNSKLYEDHGEILAKGANKGRALIELARLKSWTVINLVAIGDNLNDLEMLETAGIGVALENAPALLKNVADYVTTSPNNRGVVEAISNIAIKKEWTRKRI